MKKTGRILALVSTLLLFGIAANPRSSSRLVFEPNSSATNLAQSGALHVYLGALMHRDYGTAYAHLTGSERRYFHNARNLASVFEADHFRLRRYAVAGSIGNDARRIIFVREQFSVKDFAHNSDVTLDATVPYGILRSENHYDVKDAGHPWKALVLNVDSTNRGASVAVRKVSLFPKYVQLLLTFVNRGDGFLTILPYRKSVLKDDRGSIYRIIEAKDWRITDKQLFLGLRIAGNAQYTGFLNFGLPKGSIAGNLHLEVAPLLRDGDAVPFSVSLPTIDLTST
ncbi:MAG: hypothetical protein M3160_04515 [Candidatus Eremiobacteraeota bacterium]|nr:hypothetical protein [Candidatus Eremiobacteraeota bacterium]